MLTPEQQEAYDHAGYAILRGLVPRAACERMCERIWEALDEVHGIRETEPDTWSHPMPRGLQALCKADGLAELASPGFVAATDALLGAGTWDPPTHWGGPLPNFPTRSAWDVPFRMWHLDYPVRGRHGSRFATKALCILAPLAEKGGGTLLLEGSHHVCARLADATDDGDAGNAGDVRRQLAREHTWFRDLVSRTEGVDRVARFMEEGGEVDGIRLRVVELTGEPGDVVFFHPWLFHNSSPNASDRPRMLVGQNLVTRDGLSIYANARSRK